MRIEGLSKALTHFDMQDVFQIIPEDTIQRLSSELDPLFLCQTEKEQAMIDLNTDRSDKTFISCSTSAKLATAKATTVLESIDIKNVNLITAFKALDETEIRLSNCYYGMYVSSANVENLAWSAYRILSTCENTLR